MHYTTTTNQVSGINIDRTFRDIFDTIGDLFNELLEVSDSSDSDDANSSSNELLDNNEDEIVEETIDIMDKIEEFRKVNSLNNLLRYNHDEYNSIIYRNAVLTPDTKDNVKYDFGHIVPESHSPPVFNKDDYENAINSFNATQIVKDVGTVLKDDVEEDMQYLMSEGEEDTEEELLKISRNVEKTILNDIENGKSFDEIVNDAEKEVETDLQDDVAQILQDDVAQILHDVIDVIKKDVQNESGAESEGEFVNNIIDNEDIEIYKRKVIYKEMEEYSDKTVEELSNEYSEVLLKNYTPIKEPSSRWWFW